MKLISFIIYHYDDKLLFIIYPPQNIKRNRKNIYIYVVFRFILNLNTT